MPSDMTSVVLVAFAVSDGALNVEQIGFIGGGAGVLVLTIIIVIAVVYFTRCKKRVVSGGDSSTTATYGDEPDSQLNSARSEYDAVVVTSKDSHYITFPLTEKRASSDYEILTISPGVNDNNC